jgi:PAS domain S-box-containing protein
MMTPNCAEILNSLFPGDGEMANLMRSHDWSKTPLGAVENWPQSLRTTLSLVLSSRYPMFVWWGPEYANLYNDAYRPILGASKHPQFLGLPGKDCWAEIWDVIGVMIDNVFTKGESTWFENFLLLMYRYGYIEETYFTFSYSPVRDESGGIGGVFCACIETTEQVIADRRLSTLRELASKTAEAKTSEAACDFAVQALAQNLADIPFALLYLSDGKQAQLITTLGIEKGTSASPEQVDLSQEDDAWYLARVNRTAQAEKIDNLEQRFGKLPGGACDLAPTEALVMPIAESGKPDLAGFLVLGVNPRRKFDDNYQGFFDLIANNVAKALASAQAYEAERQRAEALAEIDRAKTLFFNNVSHEFRTPLTLMLAPAEDALADRENPLAGIQRDRIQVVQRNGQRLLKLVNTLLDFSRIEAGRIEAVYEPTDLANFTADLASTFRSLIERAGLALEIDCPPLSTFIYVDKEMWEKIIFNLLSNAFKFTLAGKITVRLKDYDKYVELTIQDTGIGIAPEEIPHLFERFYRVKGSQGRSFEGSGIGLSLVQELIKLHQGNIKVTSQVGQGSCFTVSIPTGTAHLPIQTTGRSRTLESTALRSSAYIEEAERWLIDTNQDASTKTAISELNKEITHSPVSPITQKSRILLVEDNADMRYYVQRLLAQCYVVETASDGIAALTAIEKCKPDLVLTDVMMPRLDGFGLLQRLRNQPQTRELPIILLSARAGEEARIEGLERGADDYLIKPFSTRELLARVEANLKMAQIRQEVAVRENKLRLAAEQAKTEAQKLSDRLISILESMGDAFINLDQDWRINYINAAGEKINNNKSRFEVLGKTHWEAWPASAGSNLEYQYRRAVTEQIPVDFEYHYYVPPEYDVWVEIHAYPHQDGLAIFYRDISERKRTEAILQNNQIQLQQQLAEIEAIYQSAPIGLNFIDTNLRFVRINQRLAEINGHSVEAHLGRTVREILPNLADIAEPLFHSILETGEPLLNVEITGETPAQPGVRRTWLEHFLPLKNGNEIIGINTVCEEITERKQVEIALQQLNEQLETRIAERTAELQLELVRSGIIEQQLRQSEERFQAFMNHNPACAWITDIKGQIIYANNTYYQTFKVLNKEVVGSNIFEFYPSDISQQYLKDIQAVSTGKETVQKNQKFLKADGIMGEFLVYIFPLANLSGEQLFGGIAVDITASKRIENALQASEIRYRAIVEDQTEMIARFLPDTTILFVNDAYCRYFNVNRDELIGNSCSPVIYEADLEKVNQLVQSMSIENPMQIIENRVINGQGEIRWTQWVNRMLFDQQGNFIELQSVGRDITELKNVEQALRESEERLQLALEASGDGIWDWNIVTNEVYYNPQYFEMLGYGANELPHSFATWEQLVHPEDIIWVREILAKHLENSAVRYDFDYRLQTKSGDWKWIANYGKVVAWDEDGKPLRMIGTHRDISDRKLFEAALQKSEEQRRLAIDLTHIGCWDLHLPSGDLIWNENHFTLLGLPANISRPKVEDWLQCIHPDDVKRIEQVFQASLANQTDYAAEYRVVYPDGSIHWLMARGKAIYDHQNQPLRSLGIVLDISDRKHIEASLWESNRRWRSLLDNVQLVVIGLDINGNVEYANPFFLQLTGYELEEVLGQYWFDFLNPEQKNSLKVIFREVLEHNFHPYYQNPVLTKSGEERMIGWNNTILRDVTGQPIGTMSIGEDITERYKVERMKAEFISVVSHELRTPLTSMQAALSLLSEKIIDPNSEEGEATIQIATEGTDRLVRLVNDILDLERLESGKIRLEKHLCNVGDLIETAIAQMQEMANQVNITIQFTPHPLQIEADGDRLLQVITNLLSNAIKFSPNHSTIELAVEQQQSQAAGTFLCFMVRDRGRGIPSDNLESIFARFHQVDASDSREKGGTGLGLAICRSIVRQHGGEIWAESILGKGSTFFFTLPMQREN